MRSTLPILQSCRNKHSNMTPCQTCTFNHRQTISHSNIIFTHLQLLVDKIWLRINELLPTFSFQTTFEKPYSAKTRLLNASFWRPICLRISRDIIALYHSIPQVISKAPYAVLDTHLGCTKQTAINSAKSTPYDVWRITN